MAIEPIDQPKHEVAVLNGGNTRFPPSNRTSTVSSVTPNGVTIQGINQATVGFNTTVAPSGVVVKTANATQAPFKAIMPASSVYTFTQNYAIMQGQQLLTFRNMSSYSLTPAQITRLTALSAPMTLA